MAEFTPGPWTVEDDWTAEIRGADGSLIGNIVLPSKAADARLIAAAPDMLAALKAVAEWMPRNICVTSEGGEDEVLASIQAVIARAEGRQP